MVVKEPRMTFDSDTRTTWQMHLIKRVLKFNQSTQSLYTMATAQSSRLPLDQYAAKQGVLTCLLLSAFCLLPRSTWPWAPSSKPPSMDRPEWDFLIPITSNPRRTMAYDILGVSLCMMWWSPTLRQWWSTERLTDRDARAKQTLMVSPISSTH